MTFRSTLDAALAAADLHEIDAICDRFESAWRAGRRPDLASFLSEAPPGGLALLFRDLLNLDLEFRVKSGETLDAQSYIQKFPELADHVDAAFALRRDNPSLTRLGQRTDWAGGSTVSSLNKSDPAIEASPWDQFTMGAAATPVVRGYEILDELGRGGMGIVFKAHQVALNRAVALKMIKSGGFASEAELLRFQNEAEAVARLDHPHIVPIYEVGRHLGRHYFSMKLIAGKSLDRRLGDFIADFRQGARVTATVARAVHHAHQRGILHRDLKPANILLDEQGEPHVTDFGLARQIEGNGELSESGTPVGTPSYMAPEQASGDKGALSTATDVYGLGTILYALLAGRAPFAGTTVHETLDKVRNSSPELPSRVNKRVPRDLEIICLKCLEKEPNRRYPSALALAEDLERWLDGMPILARPVGSLTRAVMWCRRNKALASLAALLMLALVGGLAGVTWKWREADHERAKNEAVIELLNQGLLAQASLELDPLEKNLSVRELLDRTAARLGGWLQDQPETEAKIRETIGGAYLSLARYEPAEKHLRAATQLDTQLYGPKHRDTLRANNLLASLFDQTNRGGEAEQLLRQNLDDCRIQLGRDDRVTLDAAERLGTILWHVGKGDEAEAVLRTNVNDRSRVLTPEHPETLRSTYLLSRLLRERRQFADAENFAYLFAQSVKCSLGANHPDNVVALTNQADVLRDQGKLAAAEPIYRQAAVEAERIRGAEDPSTVAAKNDHARVLSEMAQRPAGQ
jgi:eukaryotic-like serine/threonine-protein kinase